jgi:hypothetical protein
MVYAKYITRPGKDGKPVKYGPYYYKSVRTPEGKVRNIYMGTKPVREKQKKNGKMNLRQIKDALASVFLTLE